MANDLSANPWRIDTAGASVIYSFPVRIKNINWSNYTLGGSQTCNVQDSNGKDILLAVTGTGTQMQQINTGDLGWVRGIKVPTLGSGELTIAIGAGK
jgi:hypothetical protein